MGIFDDLLDAISDGVIVDARIGLNWTAVVADVDGELRCGLASTIGGHHSHGGDATIPWAGTLIDRSAKELAAWIKQDNLTRRSLGMATVNALLPRHPDRWVDCNAEQVIASHGKGKPVVLVGHFPFVDELPYWKLADGSYSAEELVSRKKQLLPVLLAMLEG